MSGSELKEAAIQGKHARVCSILQDRANPCSADEYGLTPLMYACWNGHVECVKYIISNSLGVDNHGKKVSCVSMVSCKGYSALHLTVLDAPDVNDAASKIISLLLLLGCDQNLKSRDNMTAHDIAIKLGRTSILKAFRDFNEQDHDIAIRMELDDLRRELKNKYSFNYHPKMVVEPWKANFEIPEFLFESQRAGYIAKEMKIHENQLVPLLNEAFYVKEGKDSLHCLEFAKEQSDINQARRAKLVTAGDATWEIPEVVDRAYTAQGRRRGKKRDKADDVMQMVAPPLQTKNATL